jgi:hypothetical protein
MKTTSKTSLTDKIITGLKKAAVELEEFRLQAALGKADFKDAFEETKRKFNKFVHEAKAHAADAKGIAMVKAIQLKIVLEELQVQLALGKADTKDIFEAQRKKISLALNELETLIRKNKTADEYYIRLQVEIEKFKIKMDILKLHYELSKLDTKNEFQERKQDFSGKLSDIKKHLLEKEEEWGHFRHEISEAYSHLKKAFVK